MVEHTFYLKADWPGGRNSVGFIDAGNLKTKISIPPEMNGPGEGTNPDEMLLGAAATCYIITLAAMIERAGLPLLKMSHESEGIVEFAKGVITYKKIIHMPTVVLGSSATEKQMRELKLLTEKAEKSCMISRAIQGNVEIELKASLSIEKE
ncbi:peroxiredoxin-like protein [Salirhabdus euzebyi]|uniref:Peroxiredoxin-like protein n=1 Tax=Salirhabdus euzebyi TaxID=394506 RepID=A0A841Q643_9BACI|nr:OsmC family protein [Salirhabdus euzebyi]MBB6453880.1 peroxiredoxin-like protein [Salirhabdus euzebyi]